jgi:hypothetical protein
MYPQQRCAENSSGGDVTKPLEVFAERRLRRGSDTETEDILLQFGPVIRQDGAAFCRYTVSGVDGSLTRDIWGIDGVQAVQLAMAMAGLTSTGLPTVGNTASQMTLTANQVMGSPL